VKQPYRCSGSFRIQSIREYAWGFCRSGRKFQLNKDNTYDFKKAKNDFTVGYQFGAQLEIKKLIVNAKYEGAFSKDERNFINKVSGSEIRYDNRPNLFMVG
jgi:hypothetical protein